MKVVQWDTCFEVKPLCDEQMEIKKDSSPKNEKYAVILFSPSEKLVIIPYVILLQ